MREIKQYTTLLLSLLFSASLIADTQVINSSLVIQSVMENGRIVNGGSLTLQGIATGDIVVEEGGTFTLLGTVSGIIKNEGGSIIISGSANSVIASAGNTVVNGFVGSLSGSGDIEIKPGAIIAGIKH